MSNVVSHPEAIPTSAGKASTARKLIQAAALASVLVPLGSVAMEADSINCISQGSGSCILSFTSGAGEQSNVWKFFGDFDETDLIYTLEIKGTPQSNFSLDVSDFVTTQGGLAESEALANFPDDVCLPTFDEGQCGLFDVFEVDGQASWDSSGYFLTITWFTNADPLSQPPDDGRNRILQAKNETGGVFGNALIDTLYDPNPTPIDPAIGGRGDSFSRFGAFRTVPEPATLILLGTGLAGLIARSRRQRRHS